MPPKAIKLGKPEILPSGKVRWQFQHRGHKKKSKTYDQDSRRTRESVRQEKREFIDEIDRQEEQDQQANDPFHDARMMIAEPIRGLIEHAQQTNAPDKAALWQELLPMLTDADPQKLIPLLAIMRGITPPTIDEELESLAKTFQSARLVVEDRNQTAKRMSQSIDHELKAEAQADEFIALYKSKANSGQVSVGRYGKVRAGINRFVEWFGPNKSLATISEQTVISYYHHLTKTIEEGANQNTVSDDHSIFKLFVESVADTIPEVLRPSNLRSERYYIPRVSTEPNPFTIEECKLFLGNATESTELDLLLMLNCGMYQGDVAELKASEVDWEHGRIVRNRSKRQKIMRTKKRAKVEKVNWLLWDRTWELLQNYGNREGLVLLNEKGEPLVQQGINSKTGKEWRRDAIRSRFNRIVTKLKNRGQLSKDWGKTLEQLRKTGANLIEKSEDHAEFYGLYLDHSSTARKHYLSSGEPVPKFDAAIRWLGEQLDFKTSR